MAKSRWPLLASHGLGLFVLLIAVFLLADPVSAKALVATDGQTGDPDYTCGPDKPCAIGCCGQNNICGMGPDYCSAANCINSCDAKSECDPANWGPQYAASEKCPLNVCCSKFGFCGTTEEFCGNTQIASPSCPGGRSATQRTIGYYEGWGVGRSCDAMLPEQIPVAVYTHINFAFAMIDPVTFSVAPMSSGDVDLYSRVTGLKALFPDLKVWISIGGWSMNDPDQPTATTFSDVAGSTANQQKFFASLISFMSHYGFDGVDIDWEYPVAPERSGRPEDYQNFPVFLQNLRNAFQAAGKSWGLTITLPSSFWYMQHFDIVKLEPIVDWFNMMEYDIHGTWDATSVWTGPYVAAHTNLTEIDQSMKLLWRNGISPSKVVLGLGFYGRSYTLADPSCNKAGCLFTSGALAGPCTNSVGTLSYGEIKELIAGGAQPVLDEQAAVQTLTYGGNNWVSFDDETTLKMKVDYANANCLGGTMIWAASTDDSKGSAAAALAAASGLDVGPLGIHIGVVVPSDNPGLCSWTTCGGSCPAGTSTAAFVLDGCPQPTKSPFSYRQFCCPSNDVPKCELHAESLEGGCNGGSCPAGSQLLTTTQFFYLPVKLCPGGGHINVCCSTSQSLADTLGQCSWTDCGGSCPSGTQALTQTVTGDGGDSPCTSGRRTLCCGSNSGFLSNTCGWYRNAYHDTCTPGCPSGKVQLAVDSAGANCARGYGSFCCDPPLNALATRDDPQMKAFDHLVHGFMVSGTCDRNNGGLIPRQTSPSYSPSSRDMALKLAPLLGYWVWSTSLRKSIQPYRDIWEEERVATGNTFPKFDDLATAYVSNSGVDGDDLDYLEGVLCNGKYGSGALASEATSSEICQVVASQATKRDLEDAWEEIADVNKTLAERAFLIDFNLGGALINGDPTTGDALQAIVSGNARPEYFNFFPYRGNQIEMEAVFLTGTSPNNLNPILQQYPDDRFIVVHIHFNRQRLIYDRLAIDQINIRHGQAIGSLQRNGNQIPGRYTVVGIDRGGAQSFRCPPGNALDPATNRNVALMNPQNRLAIQLVRRLSTWGSNGDLFDQLNPDPATLLRQETGVGTGTYITDSNGYTIPMFRGALWGNQGRGGIAFAPDGSLYNPYTRNGGDIVNTAGFYRL